jgi:EpsI family protein
MKGSITFNVISAILLLSLTAAGVHFAAARIPGSLVQQLDTIPETIEDWTGTTDRKLPPNILNTLKATSYLQRIYRRGRSELELFVAYYAEQRAGESIHTPKHCLPGGGWEVAEMGTISVPFGKTNATVNNYVVQQGNERLRILYWYHSKSRVVANEYAAKLYLARDSMVRGTTDGTIVKITLKDRPGSLADAMAFAAGVLPNVQKCFGFSPISLK